MLSDYFLRIAINNTALYVIGIVSIIYGLGHVSHANTLNIVKTILVACISLLALGTAATPSSETGIPILTDVWLNACLAFLGVLFFIEDRHHWLTETKSNVTRVLQRLKQLVGRN